MKATCNLLVAVVSRHSLLAWLTAALYFGGAPSAFAQGTEAHLTNYISALNARMPQSGDPATVAELFADDGIQYHPFGETPGGPHGDKAALGAFFGNFKTNWADWTHIEKTRMVQGSRAVWEGIAQGHHKESGKLIKLPIVFFIDFDQQGKVKENRVYVDVHMIGDQLK